ncbi:hypothetical protein [Candidatus Vampirococcus lugosii]|nr:hypothetical protein [Candidatus Vampirococcus lugosii]
MSSQNYVFNDELVLNDSWDGFDWEETWDDTVETVNDSWDGFDWEETWDDTVETVNDSWDNNDSFDWNETVYDTVGIVTEVWDQAFFFGIQTMFYLKKFLE